MNQEPHTLTRDDIEALFETYRNGFDDFDSEAIADCFTYPVTIWQLGGGTVFSEEEDLLENIDALLTVLEREEIVSSDFAVRTMEISGSTAFVTMDWTQKRADGEAAWQFTCDYTLIVAEDGEPAIALVVNH
ncbi:hypothetical protein [Notoacmeibacter ruber]|uniref:DUF4440 domain-containing protein n=1 Tax=Notoacmeibacter ruber TaxID=2670375 RepID=A0A3L7J979_9HYPH|nr:hypothetical protein [Notoacmeibacter ruber]RLQ87233.1 hypothetical protein D8780_02410 [Notoacmeibacter ruber]